ncbi:hypothetical protein B566_EDAN018489, partial [Ephemera danica]
MSRSVTVAVSVINLNCENVTKFTEVYNFTAWLDVSQCYCGSFCDQSQLLAGMSRSVTVAVAYIMSVTNLGWKEALKVVRVGRAVANPNLGLALGPQDQAQCQRLLLSYQSLLLSRDLCEGKCTMGQERRRLQERFPSLALGPQDQAQCQRLLLSYQSLLLSRDLCEGKCTMGQVCPTGACRTALK